jgi:hypothetical protein
MPKTPEDAIRNQAHKIIEDLSEQEVRLLVAYAHQLQDGQFAALTHGLEHLLEESA